MAKNRQRVYTLKSVAAITYYVDKDLEIVFGYSKSKNGITYSRMGYATIKQAIAAMNIATGTKSEII